MFKLKYLQIIVLFALFLVFGGGGTSLHAEESKEEEPKKNNSAYQKITVENLSHLYWAVGKHKLGNDEAVDNFLFINECDIYQSFASQEFEWQSIRESGKDFIRQNISSFPLRFEFVQALKVKDYDFRREGFDVLDKHKIYSTRRFEMFAANALHAICGRRDNIAHYPKVLVIELTRPFSMLFLPVEPETAKKYIASKELFFKSLPKHKQTKEFLYDSRNIYVVMKVKLFSYQGDSQTPEGIDRADVMGVLEGYDVYADQERTLLLHSESFRRRKKSAKGKDALVEKFQKQEEAKEEKAEAKQE